MQEREKKPFIDPVKAIAALFAAICLSLAVSNRGCTPEKTSAVMPQVIAPSVLPSVSPTPPPVATSEAKSASSIKITRRPILMTEDASGSPVMYGPPWEEVIEITTNTEASATAPVVVVTPSPTPAAVNAGAPSMPQAVSEHSRLGVMAGIFPGGLALDVQTFRGKPLSIAGLFVPKEMADLELSLDVEINHLQAGALIAGGGKVFVGAGGYAGYDGRNGLLIGVGMRF